MVDRAKIPRVGDGSGLEAGPRLFSEELALAFRNHAIPLEGLRYDVTPTGMHYTLVHYDVPFVETASWRLQLGGAVQHTVELTLEELQQRPTRTLPITLECAGDGRALLSPRPLSQPWLVGAVGTAEWTGTPLRDLLVEAGLGDDVVSVVFSGLDRGIEGGTEQTYQRALSRAEALDPDVLLAWGMNGRPLEPQHGFPIRLVVPDWYGMTSVKWLSSIEALTTPFAGYQHAAYRYSQRRDEPGEPVTRMRVRSLLIPPGIPDFMTRTRILGRGDVELRGRAWSGHGPVTRVEVSTDGGASWADAAFADTGSAHGWRAWRYTWSATSAGTFELCCRATDRSGDVQPVEQFWTARGMGNNAVHRVTVVVE